MCHQYPTRARFGSSLHSVQSDWLACLLARLHWNRTFTRCTFGHYDFVHDRLWVSTTLDRPDVPDYVLDHVMHHELLHKKHGFRWRSGQQHTHIPEFRREERRFKHYHEANRFLDKLGK